MPIRSRDRVNWLQAFNGSSPNVELPCNKINGLCVVAVLVATNACQQNQIVTDSEVKMGFKRSVIADNGK